MPLPCYVLGLDFGTNSVRALLVDVESGLEVGDGIGKYRRGEKGVLVDDKNDLVARQHPLDWHESMENAVGEAIRKARKNGEGFSEERIIGIGIDTTGSTPVPVDKQGTPLAFHPEFSKDLNAYAWLWKDHSSFEEAEELTELAKKIRPHYLMKYGGAYSSEWFFAKILRCARIAPKVFKSAYSWVEASDYLPALLSGDTDPLRMKRNICSAGHKAMYNEEWGGLPDEKFLSKLDPRLAELRSRLYEKAYPAGERVGLLCEKWAKRLGLEPGIPISVGALDAHFGAVGSQVKPGTLVKIIGTSTCDMMVVPLKKKLPDIPGLCGIVPHSILPGYFGLEAGQSAVGDIFNWYVNKLAPKGMGHKELTEEAQKLRPGESGLIALDWNNGNRTVLVDPRLSGLILGQTLMTKPEEIYRALIEATAFGARIILNRFEEYGVKVKEIINCGGISEKNELLLQIYADILGRPMKLAKTAQACALGACMFAGVCAGKRAGGFRNIEEAQEKLGGVKDVVFNPIPSNQKVYDELFEIYRELHDAFGGVKKDADMAGIMKRLFKIKERVVKTPRVER